MKAAALLLGLMMVTSVFGDETVRVTHRFDWRRTVDQKYQGLVYGYLTGAWKLTPSSTAGWTDVEARYQLAAEAKRDNAFTEKAVSAEQVSRFRINPKGVMTGFAGGGVPYYRNFPAALPADAAEGSVWVGEGELVADFLGTGTPTRIPLLIEYRWAGPGLYGDRPVTQVKTKYAIRYSGQDATGDPTLAKAVGTRSGVASYDAESHQLVFVRETTQEVFTSTTGHTIGNDGVVLTFYEGMPSLATPSLVAALNQVLGNPPPTAAAPAATPPPPAAEAPDAEVKALLDGLGALRGPADLPDVSVEADPRGVKVTLENLRFVADQAVLLAGEDQRLARVAAVLKAFPMRNLLVVGHTAAVGSTASQDSLSVDRALAIVAKLKAAGIPAQRLLYEGRGGREPVASNDTEAGRAENRRVEIVILDQ